MTNTRPPVSVCLVTYNRATLLPATLDSLLAQTFSDFELIISDDCSTDDTEEICLEYARRDRRVRYYRNETNLGMPGNLNVSLQYAQGEYLANLHDGDVYRKDLLEKWKAALDDQPTAGFVFNAYRSVNSQGQTVINREPYGPLIKGPVLAYRLVSRWDSCVYGTVMARRAVYEKLGWFDPCFGNFSDVDMWLRIAENYDVAYLPEPLIDLMPRDPTRFYAFVHWRVALWLLGIHKTNLQRCRGLFPEKVAELEKKLHRRQQYFMLRQMLICLKHRRWDRVKEGLAVWRDATDRLLRVIGKVFGRSKNIPDWYNPGYWDLTGDKAS